MAAQQTFPCFVLLFGLAILQVKLMPGSSHASSNKFREFLGGNGNFFPLIDALDGCHNESVNTKVLPLFVNLLTGDLSYINLKHTLQEMDSSSLASWLEKMLLGYTAQSAVGNPVSPILTDLTWKYP